MNASIYAYSVKPLLEKDPAKFFNDRADAVEMLDTGILDIDSEEDYELMQAIAEHLYARRPDFREIRDRAHMWL